MIQRTESALLAGLATTLVLAASVPAGAQSCSVPSTPHPTIQAAVDDPSCAEILLAAQTFVESLAIARDLGMQGVDNTSTVIEGQVVASGGVVTLQDIRIDLSTPALAGRFTDGLVAGAGARLVGLNVIVLNGSMFFGDGFETGDTSHWFNTVP